MNILIKMYKGFKSLLPVDNTAYAALVRSEYPNIYKMIGNDPKECRLFIEAQRNLTLASR